MNSSPPTIGDLLQQRFGETFDIPEALPGLETLMLLAGRATHRRFAEKPVDPALVRLLSACALSAPSKSDLQQVDIVLIDDPSTREAIVRLIATMDWISTAPVFLVVCGNGRRLRQVSSLHEVPFGNDHFDAVFNPVLDAGLVLANLLTACEAVGLRTCPVSVVRNHAREIRDLLKLPELTFPVAGLCIGWPTQDNAISPRLAMTTTVHHDRHDDADVLAQIQAYDRRRGVQTGWDPDSADFKGWSRQKAEMYSKTQRADFGDFLREQGFSLD